jgi:hypothetical protein
MSIVQSLMLTPQGAIGVYLGIGVAILVAGWAADMALAGRSSR